MKVDGWTKVNRYHWRYRKKAIEIRIRQIAYGKWTVTTTDNAYHRFSQVSQPFDRYTLAEYYAIQRQRKINEVLHV